MRLWEYGVKIEDIKAYCQSKNRAYEDHPFGDIPVCYKLNGKIFAQIYPLEEERKITLKCSRDAGDFTVRFIRASL